MPTHFARITPNTPASTNPNHDLLLIFGAQFRYSSAGPTLKGGHNDECPCQHPTRCAPRDRRSLRLVPTPTYRIARHHKAGGLRVRSCFLVHTEQIPMTR